MKKILVGICLMMVSALAFAGHSHIGVQIGVNGCFSGVCVGVNTLPVPYYGYPPVVVAPSVVYAPPVVYGPTYIVPQYNRYDYYNDCRRMNSCGDRGYRYDHDRHDYRRYDDNHSYRYGR